MNLDADYTNAPYIPDAESYPPRWAQNAAAFRAEMGERAVLDVSYGTSARQAFDVFRTDGAAKGTLVFVHGGYWFKFGKSDWSHFAKGALQAHWDVALVQYDLCPEVTIAQITRQVAAALTAIAAQTEGLISLAGHSAGGHLVARMLAPAMVHDAVRARIKAVAPISPVADLRPLLQTSMNAQFRLDMAAAEAESAILQPKPAIPVKIWVGGDERPGFLEQARNLSAAWGAEEVVVPGKHHFDIIDALRDGQSDVIRFLTS